MAADNTGMPDLSGLLDTLQKNPELLKTAMSIFASPEKNEKSDSNDSAPSEPAFDPSVLTSLLPALSGRSEGHRGGAGDPHLDRHIALLRALRPYLSHERQTAIDYLLQFGKMGDILKLFDKKE